MPPQGRTPIERTTSRRRSCWRYLEVRRAGALGNLALLASALSTSVSGLALQVGFHLGAATPPGGPFPVSSTAGASAPPVPVLAGLDRSQWGTVHDLSALILSLLLLQHLIPRRACFARLLRRGTQLRWLTLLTLLVAVTGLAAWGLALGGGRSRLHFILIEIHDKLALPLILLFLLHVAQRVRRLVPRT